MIPKKITFWGGPYLFILPCFVVYALFLLTPLFGTFAFSLTRWDGISFDNLRFIGLQNYKELFFDDPTFWLALRNNLVFVGGAVVFQCILGLAVALLLEQKLVLGNFFRGTYLIPFTISLVVIGIVFESILNPSLGVLDKVLTSIGLEEFTGLGLWLGKAKKAIWILIFIQAWYGFGWSMLIFVSRLKAIDPQLYEAARVDGATEWQKIVFITIPLLKSITAVVVLFATMWAMKIFTIPYVVTRGGPNHATEVLATWAFSHGLSYQHIGYGSTIAVVLVVIAMIIGSLLFRLTGMGKAQE
ncbi:hypothetical protein CEE34_02250 [Candidatus Aerophobetes bacterium Ae_b3a]|nr:MAG: hypothetical protein CEE34_02250 [Candidatus Aerophobetes bacterium Ae_b3a]